MTPQTIETLKGQTMFCLFDGTSELVAFARQHKAYHSGRRNSFWDDMSGSDCLDCVQNGDLSRVAESDKFLEQFESQALPSATHEIIANVVGGIPHIPNYLAGVPESMRYRRKSNAESAPLAIIVDLTSSAGIKSDDIRKRGVALLAFTRAISAKRPVELWAVAGLGGDGATKAYWAGCRLDTAPMDLARACPTLASTAFPRNVLYRICRHHGSNGKWPYNGGALNAETTEKVFRPAMPHVADMLCVPGVYLTDPLIRNPVKWINDRLEEYGGAIAA